MEYKFPRKTPQSVRKLLRKTFRNLHAILKSNLVGIYLYGSLAMECFNPRFSDIDVLLIVKEKLPSQQRKKIINYLRRSCSKNKRKPIELSIIQVDAVQTPHYPLAIDLHYEYWGCVFENEKDKEILSNLYTTKKRGFRVWGKPIDKIFSKIPAQYHLRSVVEDIIYTRKYLHKKPERSGYNVPVYWVLSSSRILAFIRERKVLSKLEGGEWGLTNLPQKYEKLINQALSCYQGKTENPVWNAKELEAFADHMIYRISRESKLKNLIAPNVAVRHAKASGCF
jgi:streptomycin 3"-adenylyltransferase